MFVFLGFHHLQKIYLGGFLNLVKLPDQFPPNLTKLTLNISYLQEDPMPTLEKLSNLRCLSLNLNAYVGKEMVCSALTPKHHPMRLEAAIAVVVAVFLNSFLFLYGIHTLEEWIVEGGAIPSLLLLDCPLMTD